MKLRRLLLPTLAAASVALTACGDDGPQKTTESEGTYVTIGSIQYQVQISRQLNPRNVEDKEYLRGLNGDEQALEPDEVWFGIFLRTKNLTDVPLDTARDFRLEDTVGDEFSPIYADNITNYSPTVLDPGDVWPHSNEITSYVPQGKLLLFKVRNQTLDNRPLEMRVIAPDGDEGSVEIDV